MTHEPIERSAHYRQNGRGAGSVRVPGSGWAWFLGILLALLASYGLHAVARSWWFSYFTGVLPGGDSEAGWWSVAGGAMRWSVALAVALTTGASLSHLTRRVPAAVREPVKVWCFRRSAPSLKLGLGLLAAIAGGTLYAAFDAGENPAVDSTRDELVLTAFLLMTAAAGTLAVIYAFDLVRIELLPGRADLHTGTGRHRVIDLRALAVDRFVVRTRAFSETYFLAGWFPKRATQLVGAYALEAACIRDENTEPEARPVEAAPPLQWTGDEVLALPGAAWPWWIGGAGGLGFAAWAIGSEITTSLGGRHWQASVVALSLFLGWVVAVLIASCLPGTRARRPGDPRPIRFRLLLAGARREQHVPTIPSLRTLAVGAAITLTLVLMAVAVVHTIPGVGMFLGVILLLPLPLLYLLVTPPGIWFLLVNPMRVLRDGRTLEVDSTGAWLDGHRVTACESKGGAVVVYTGPEPTWLRVASMSRDPARWKREADAIAAYTQQQLDRAAKAGD